MSKASGRNGVVDLSKESNMKKCVIKKAFTLIELLVVIGIIGILAAILLPAISAALQRAKKAEAQTTAKGLETAIKQFYNEYNKYPNPDTKTEDFAYGGESGGSNRKILEVLTATYTDPKFNPRKIVFFEVSSTSTNANGVIDPWDTPYGIVLDYKMDDDCKDVPGNGGKTVASRGVVVWSAGPDAKDGTDAEDGDNIKSW